MCRLRRVFVAMRRFGSELNKRGLSRGISLVAVAGYISGSDAPRVNPRAGLKKLLFTCSLSNLSRWLRRSSSQSPVLVLINHSSHARCRISHGNSDAPRVNPSRWSSNITSLSGSAAEISTAAPARAPDCGPLHRCRPRVHAADRALPAPPLHSDAADPR